MNRIPVILVVGLAFIIIVIAVIRFSDGLIKASLPKDFENFDTPLVTGEVKIFKNYYGIPHIITDNESDLFFAMGFYHASDRLWQMDYYRRLSQGRLSEIFGDESILVDKFLRCFMIDSTAQKCYDNMSEQSKAVLQRYSQGVNFYMSEYRNKMPFEFGALAYQPDEWLPYHSILIGRVLTFELSLGIWADAAYGEIASKFGYEKARLLIPGLDKPKPTQIDSNIFSTTFDQDLSLYSDKLTKIRNDVGIVGSSSGSNCWVFRNVDSISQSAILANDAHLPLTIPARWLQMQFTTKGINAVGLSLPGIPLLMSGRNDNIAWGISNIMADDFDYFVERIENEHYYVGENKKKIRFHVDTIFVKDKEPHVYYQRFTETSPIISDFHINRDPSILLNLPGKTDTSFFVQNAMSFRWVGNNISDEILTLYKLARADNYDEFKSACNHWSNPGLNFHYADNAGNIGLKSAADIPARGKDCDPNLPNPAWIDTYQWKGFNRLENEKVSRSSKEAKFIASANEKIENVNYISNYWEPESRINRINEVLTLEDKHGWREAQYLQNDYYSDFAKKMSDIIVPILDKYSSLMTVNELRVLNSLNDWDYIILTDIGLSSFINVYTNQFIYNIFHDDFGPLLYNKFTFVSSIPTRLVMDVLTNSKYDTFIDNLRTNETEIIDDIIFETYRASINHLIKHFNSGKINDWKYGNIHQLNINHVFSRQKFLSPSVTLGPFEMSGNNTTVNNTEWNFTNPYAMVIGASMRFIADMNEDFIFTVVPGGASGDPASPNFSDQVRIWLNGGYLKIPFGSSPAENYRLAVSISPER
ncbi:MAG: penicillin acylase family protein [Candidatus Kapabacteria bacterium]|nr:penicillin acylase family protein [Candidatus Kapabacteria bacterium]